MNTNFDINLIFSQVNLCLHNSTFRLCAVKLRLFANVYQCWIMPHFDGRISASRPDCSCRPVIHVNLYFYVGAARARI